jgi:hypothetical protein
VYRTVNMLCGDWCWYVTWGFHGDWSCYNILGLSHH